MDRSGWSPAPRQARHPVLHHRAQDSIKVSRAVARDQRPRLFRGRRLAEAKDDLGTACAALPSSARHRTGRGQRRPCPRAGPPVRALRDDRGAVAPKKLRPITCPRALAPAEVGKGHTASELAIPGVACEHGPRCRVNLGDDEGRRGVRDTPSTHSTYAVTETRLGRPE